VAAWIAIGACAFFVFQSETQVAVRASAMRTFDLRAREAADALAVVRSGQQAYVAAGQGIAFWVPKVATTTDAVSASLGTLRETATDASTRAALDQAADTVAQFTDIDKRAREYLKSDQQLMASDVIFTEGVEAAASAARSVEAARIAELQAIDARAATTRNREALALGISATLAAIVILLLTPGREAQEWRERLKALQGLDGQPTRDRPERPGREGLEGRERLDGQGTAEGLDDWSRLQIRRTQSASRPAESGASAPSAPPARPASPAPPALPALPAPPAPPAPPSPVAVQGAMLKAAADLATEFGRARDTNDLNQLLGRAATAMDASGVVVWMGSTTGADLRPLLIHGYGAQAMARIPPVPRSADNAAAAAYRSGHMQIVLSKPGASGAIVAPILAPDGCVGALSAEFSGAETSESVQALAAIVAGHLATVLAGAPAETVESRTAVSQ